MRTGVMFTALLALLWVAPDRRVAADEVKVPAAVRKAVADYLAAKPKKQKSALKKALKAIKDDVAVAAEALRTMKPLTKGKAETTTHGVEFESLGKNWVYSIYLPKGYDNKTRFPVLVLPDHGAVDAEAGISFWAGKWGDKYILFRPVIVKHQNDKKRFKEQQFLRRDQALAQVMLDALTHLRLNYAVDHDRFAMTGLSQAGFYTWYYAISFPDQFAAIIPESAGGTVMPALIYRHAPNLTNLKIRVLHSEGDEITPYEHAKGMVDRLKQAGADPELITYTDADYGGNPFPKRHPGPHHLRLQNVLTWACEQRRTIPVSVDRHLRHVQQGYEGRFHIEAPQDVSRDFRVKCELAEDGTLTATGAKNHKVAYLVSPEDVLAGKQFIVRGKVVKDLEGDVKLMLEEFRRTGDPGRLVAARIPVR